MKFEVKKGQKVYIGSMPLTVLEDTVMRVEANSIDHVAEMLATAGPRGFGDHREALTHKETKRELIDGVNHEVDYVVSYGAGGARLETKIQDSKPRKLNPDGTLAVDKKAAEAKARGGIGTETVPGASGTGARRGALRDASAFDDDPEDAIQSTPRTEFVVPPKRFPDEVLTATDPPIEEVVRDSPARSTPYVGEFTREGAFARDGALADRVGTEGRPNPDPNTPGTRDRVLPAPSETDKNTDDEPARKLQRAEKPDDKKTTDETNDEDDDQDMSKVGDDDEHDLPEDFPHRAALEKAGVSTWADLEGKSAEELSGEDFKGVGPAGAEKILAEVKKKKRRDAYREKRRTEK